jgi:hypothetical protein
MDPDPDPSINKQKIKKNFNFYSFVTLVISYYGLDSSKTDVNVPSVSKKQKKTSVIHW